MTIAGNVSLMTSLENRGPDRLPKQQILLGTLPFLSVTDLIVEKIKCCAERTKTRDAEDVGWLVENMQAHITYAEVCLCIKTEVAIAALNNHPSLAFPLSSLGLVSSSV